MKIFLLVFTLSFIVLGCDLQRPNHSPIPQHPVGQNTSTQDNENLGRTLWQKPNVVIEKLGDIKDKTIVDIGAGTGYFTFRLALKGAKVIATDIDKNMINVIESFRLNLPQEIQGRIETRLVTEDDAMIKENECDIAVIINTAAYIPNKTRYFSRLKKILKQDGKIMIVDYKGSKLPQGIANSNPIIESGELVNILQKSGFTNIEVDNTTLDYQYIIIAR